MSTGRFHEPAVLAEAKEFLTPDSEAGYTVVDAQFRQSSWGDQPVSEAVRRQLQPINALSMGGGEPDAVMAPPRRNAYREPAGNHINEIPLAVVEAKGETASSHRNAPRVAITQAHGHLEEANLGFAALPESMVREENRALARELNVGLVVVGDSGAELWERPRLVGSETSDTADTIRFHARLGGLTVESLKKNHPKNGLGYAIAVQAGDNPDALFKEYVIKSVDDARLDARALGLVDDRRGQKKLTALGREAVRTVVYHHGGAIEALEAIEDLTDRSVRFIDETPVMGTVARQVLLAYPPTQVLVKTLDDLAEEDEEYPSLARVAKKVARERPNFALDLFVSPADRERVLTGEEDELDVNAFDDGNVYSTHTTYQYKAMLFHVGLIKKDLHDTKSELNPNEAVWALERV